MPSAKADIDTLTAGEPAAAAGKDAQDDTLAAIVAALKACQRLLIALRELAGSEARLVRATLPILIVAAVALVALAVSMWACLVALVAWLLFHATQSFGVAMGVLIGIHVILLFVFAAAIKYVLRQLTFPRTRAELRWVAAHVWPGRGRDRGMATPVGAGRGPVADSSDPSLAERP